MSYGYYPPHAGAFMPQMAVTASAPQMQPLAMAAPEPAAPEKKYSVYVKQPVRILTDEDMERALKACGHFSKWKPNVDPATGKSKLFGFAEFSHLRGVARAIRVIGEMTLLDPVHKQPYQIAFKADKATNVLLGVLVKEEEQEQSDQAATEQIRLALVRFLPAPGTVIEPVGAAAKPNGDSKDDRMRVLQEKYPLSSGQFVAGSQGESPVAQESAPAVNDRDAREQGRRGLGFGPENQVWAPEGPKTTLEQEEQEERAFEERRHQEKERFFQERLRRWMTRENYHGRLNKEHARRDQENEERLKHARESMARFLAEYDDDVEDKRGEDDWYTHRDRWAERRRVVRDRERQWDARVKAKIAQEQRRIEGHHTEQRDTTETRSETTTSLRQHAVDNLADARAALRSLITKRLAFLLPDAPADLSDDRLANYHVRWNLLTQETIHEKLAPLIDQRLTAFLGSKDSDMAEFVLEAILPPSPDQPRHPREALEEILVAFGESPEEHKEAEAVVAAVWKRIIWETEKAHLAQHHRVDGVAALEITHVL